MRDPRALIDTATLAASLAASLGDASLRVFDCTTYLEPTPAGSAEPYIAVPGRKTFEDGHVPGADFLDLQGEFSDTATHLHFMMPSVARLEAAFGRHGVGPGTRKRAASTSTSEKIKCSLGQISVLDILFFRNRLRESGCIRQSVDVRQGAARFRVRGQHRFKGLCDLQQTMIAKTRSHDLEAERCSL